MTMKYDTDTMGKNLFKLVNRCHHRSDPMVSSSLSRVATARKLEGLYCFFVFQGIRLGSGVRGNFLIQILKLDTSTNFRKNDIFDSRIIRRMICGSMLSTKMQKLLQCTVAVVNQTALRALCFFFKRTGT